MLTFFYWLWQIKQQQQKKQESILNRHRFTNLEDMQETTNHYARLGTS